MGFLNHTLEQCLHFENLTQCQMSVSSIPSLSDWMPHSHCGDLRSIPSLGYFLLSLLPIPSLPCLPQHLINLLQFILPLSCIWVHQPFLLANMTQQTRSQFTKSSSARGHYLDNILTKSMRVYTSVYVSQLKPISNRPVCPLANHPPLTRTVNDHPVYTVCGYWTCATETVVTNISWLGRIGS